MKGKSKTSKISAHAFGVWAFCCLIWAWGWGCPALGPVGPEPFQEPSQEAEGSHEKEASQGPELRDGGELFHEIDVPRDGGEIAGEADGGGGWEDRALVPWEGLDADAGIPEGYDWGEPGRGYAQQVLSFRPAAGASFGHSDFPAKILGPPKGLGDAKGSLDVVSLGCGGTIILEFSRPLIGNGPGIDFVIFENAFYPGGGKETFAEPAEVSVSIDGKNWRTFPCQPDKTVWPYSQCAGVRPVYSNPNNDKNPLNPQESGGDGFDLEDVGLPFARFVKIEDKSALTSESAVWCGSYNAGFDLDAVAVIWGYQPK